MWSAPLQTAAEVVEDVLAHAAGCFVEVAGRSISLAGGADVFPWDDGHVADAACTEDGPAHARSSGRGRLLVARDRRSHRVGAAEG